MGTPDITPSDSGSRSPELDKLHGSPDMAQLNEQARLRLELMGGVQAELRDILQSEKLEKTPYSTMEIFLAKAIKQEYPDVVLHRAEETIQVLEESSAQFTDLIASIEIQDPIKASEFRARKAGLDIASITQMELLQMGSQALNNKYKRDIASMVSGEEVTA